MIFCKGCEEEYKKLNVKEIQNRCNRQDVMVELKDEQELHKVMGQNPIVVFYLGRSEASTVYKDFLVYYCAINKLQKTELPQIYAINCENPTTQTICQKYSI